MGAHLVDGKFKSDKYAEVRAGLLPLSFTDPAAQSLIAEYSRRRRAGSHGSKEVDVEFADDVDEALRLAGYQPKPRPWLRSARTLLTQLLDTEEAAPCPEWAKTYVRAAIAALGDAEES